MDRHVHFQKWDCEVVEATYMNGRRALRLVDALSGEPIATATVNLPDVEIPEGCVAIKDYFENDGMLDALMEAGIVSSPKRLVRSGFVLVPVCEYYGNKEEPCQNQS